MLKKILIADNDPAFRLALSEALCKHFSVRCCSDGVQALEQLRMYQPDLLVLDLVLPELDGLSILHTAREEGICPQVFVVSSFLGHHVSNALQPYDVVYAVQKPCNVPALACRIEDLLDQFAPPLFLRPSPASQVSAALMELNVVSSRNGYHYCRQAILMLAENPSLQVTKCIYPSIAKEHGCQAASVEKAIRDTIAAAWDHRCDEIWRRYFPAAPNGQIPRPSNRMFLTTLAEVLFTINEIAK